MSILILIGVFILGFVCGWYTVKIIVLKRIKKIIAAVNSQEQTESYSAVAVKFERINDQIYAYTNDGHEFLAQGTTKDELITILKSRFPNTSFTASPKNMEEVGLEP